MLDVLRKHDAGLAELNCADGSVLVSPGLQGRIFGQINDELIHRLDVELLRNPSSTEFNNIGGNSLWPAPEGGTFAFNYPPGGGAWRVQRGIAETPARIVHRGPNKIVAEKRIDLVNRKGAMLDIMLRRTVSLPPASSSFQSFSLAGLTYRCEDTFEPLGSYSTDDVLLAPWSLEQFPGAEGIMVFCKVADPENAVNDDFYDSPGDRIAFGDRFFTFALGGEDRHQIGVPVCLKPSFIGALDPDRSMLMLRRATATEGTYFNIADNDQPKGPFSAADLYSVFNGGALNFFELETIGAMKVKDGHLAASTLSSETTLLKGNINQLKRYLALQEGLRLSD